MSQPRKRYRQEINCDGCGCGNPQCVCCFPPEVIPASFGPFVPIANGPYYNHFTSQHGRLPLYTPPPPAAANPGLNYDYMVSQLDNNTVRLILARLATVSPSTQAAIASSYQQQMRMVRERVVDFNEYAVTAWHVLNTSEYTEGSGSKQYEASFEARSDVIDCINSIGEETKAESSFGTKLSALETLLKIAKTILIAGDTLGREVRLEFQHESCLADIMVYVAQSMTPEEQRRAGAITDEKGSLAMKVHWVCDQAEGHCLSGFDGLRDVLALLTDAPDRGQETRP